ncbi:MAG: AAA family ATPase [Candidatus Nanoarchaeia archaeon]|nr:AAA family ATPase [Candidatus Nanoarchaeia archaeon]MDD5740662.1 AAA family ATPase [Candidatus Nanoarchaeia archaeon]
MAEKGGMFPITKEALEKHEADLEAKMGSIRIGERQRANLSDLLKNIKIDKDWTEFEEAFRRGSCLYYEMYDTLQNRIAKEKIDGNIPESEKRAFLGAYSVFAASSFIENRLNKNLKEDAMEYPVSKDFSFDFSQTQNDVANDFLALLYSITAFRKDNDLLKGGSDLISSSIEYFRFMKNHAVSKKSSFNKKLVDLVSGTEFRVMDEVTISGFEARLEEKASEKIEFVKVQPYQVAGNVLAKQEMFRDMDRMPLFDLIAKKNPIMELGGLPPSVLYDGLPGTGKTKLFKAGLTRLDQRVQQLNEFWKRKNMNLKWTQVIIDQGVKSEYYSLTGRQTKERLAVTRRPDGLYVAVLDDIDLVAKMSRDTTGGGSDNDLLFSLMQYLDGLNTVLIGNTQMWAATNDAASMDPALRQRFIARYSVDGPQEWYDFSDILSDEFTKELGLGIIAIPSGKGYTPYEMRKGQSVYGTASKDNKSLVETIKSKITGGITLRDIGEFCAEVKKKNPRFTGRATHAAAEAIRQRINDYDIPEEWYVKPEEFFDLEFSEKVGRLKSLCKPVNGETILQEIERYASSEQRYADDKFESDVGKYIHAVKVQNEGANRLKQTYKDE